MMNLRVQLRPRRLWVGSGWRAPSPDTRIFGRATGATILTWGVLGRLVETGVQSSLDAEITRSRLPGDPADQMPHLRAVAFPCRPYSVGDALVGGARTYVLVRFARAPR
jgi:hypothetical protein